MEFIIEFYETSEGRCPVHEFLDELKKSNPYDFTAVLARDRQVALERKSDWLTRNLT